MNKEVTKIEYHINSFMYKLGIKNNALKVYAVLYSFTNGEIGVYYGSKKYLAAALEISERSLYNAIKELREKGLIEEYETEDARYKGIRCVRVKEREARSLAKKEKAAEEPAAKKPSPLPERVEYYEYNNEEIDEEEYFVAEVERRLGKRGVEELSSMPEHEKNMLRMSCKYETWGEDRRKFLSFGNGGVSMTEAQYEKLLGLVTGEELFLYFTKLENMLEENLKTGRKPPHSHYKVIKKWIEEDMAV